MSIALLQIKSNQIKSALNDDDDVTSFHFTVDRQSGTFPGDSGVFVSFHFF